MVDTVDIKDAAGVTRTVKTNDVLAALLGEVTASPTANTLLDRLKTIGAKDFATQTTLAAILAKIIAAPATEATAATLATQTTAAAILAKLSADPATQTTLAAVLAKLSADPATQTTLAALATLVTSSNTKLDSVISALGTLHSDLGNFEYETVAASATAQVLGATGAMGDYIAGLLVIPADTTPGLVTLLDGATSIPVFVGGTLPSTIPFLIPLGMRSKSGAWKVTTGADVSVIGIGDFTD